MDYATTFCEYSRTKPAKPSSAPHPTGSFPSVASAGTILIWSGLLQIALLWGLLLFSLDRIADYHNTVACFLGATMVAITLAFYWFASGLFTPASTTNSTQRGLPITVMLYSFFSTAVALCLFYIATRPPVSNAITGGSIGCLSVLFLAAGGAPFNRLLLRTAIRHQRLACDIVLAGDLASMRDFLRHMRENHAGVRICAAFNLTDNPHGQEIDEVPLHHGVAALLSFHARYPRPRVILLSQSQQQLANTQLALLRLQPLHVFKLDGDFCSDDADRTSCIAGIPGVKLQLLQRPPLSSLTFFLKDIFDRAAGVAALILFLPVMLACAVAIKLTSPGPVLYRQKRIGYRNNLFDVYKFRSMHIDDCDRLTLTKRGDTRVFPVGRFMRQLSIDELPQLFNVIRGEMSLVGPRPHMREARAGDRLYYDVVPEYGARHCVKPGITGWAQINGWRGPTDTEDAIRARVAHDLYYIEHWSFWFDLKILFRTILGGFSGSNAV